MNTLMLLATSLLSLNGDWQLKGWPTPDQGSVRTLEEIPAEAMSVPAKVPGCYELDLCAAGKLPNLFYANNQYAVRPYEGHQWLYSKTFDLGPVAKDEKATLTFDGLDTLCDIFLNGRRIGEAADMFIAHEFDVTKHVKEGKNELAVLFILYFCKKALGYFCLIMTVRLNIVLGYSEIFSDFCDFKHFSLLSDFDVCKHFNSPFPKNVVKLFKSV